MTDPQKYNEEFEKIAEKVVAYLLKDIDVEIRPTSRNKDGGYDIVARCFDGTSQHKIYFECKLRGSNLNLRDIAANVVIAFNEGAVCLVAMTNYDYTPQLDEQMQKFYQKTILNVKIIIGSELRKIIDDNQIAASAGLLGLFKRKKSFRKKTSGLLQLDFGSSDLYKQFLYKDTRRNTSDDIFLAKLMADQISRALEQLQAGRALLVFGFAGVGKSSFIKAVLQRLPCWQIHIDALLYETKEQLLLDLLIQIWGIPERKLLTGLTEEYIKAISTFLDGQENDKETAQVIRAILSGPEAGDVHSIRYNRLICHYIIHLLTMHRLEYNYIVFVEHLQFANEEIQRLAVYLIKVLQNRQIGCVIEGRLEEYDSGIRYDPLNELSGLSDLDTITIDILTPEEGVDFLRHMDPDIPQSTARIIVNKVGSRPYNLALILEHFKRLGIDSKNIRQIAQEVEMLTPNDLPNIIGKVLPLYRQKNPFLFHLLGLLQGRLPLELFYDMTSQDEELDQLFSEQILVYSQDHIIAANEFVLRQITECLYPPRLGPLKAAKDLLKRTAKDAEQFLWIRIRLLYYTQCYRETISALDQYLAILWRTRQYSALIEYLDIAVDSAAKLHMLEKQASYLIQQLEAMVIKKEIAGPKAAGCLDELAKLLDNQNLGENHYTFQLAHDYFCGKQAFKSGCISAEEKFFAVSRQHYEDCISGKSQENDGDWLGRICCIYALFIKELYGNDAALKVFQEACAALPDSFELRREYNSHMGCMLLYTAPLKAYKYYQTIIRSIESHPSGTLPFHEYGDVAMSLLLARKLPEAVEQAAEGIALADSYGVTDEVGRIANIKGCALLCMGRLSEAKEQFVEATVAMERSGYHLYCWRSRLNLVQIKLNASDSPREQIDFLYETYFDFKKLLQTKVKDLAQVLGDGLFRTREYHALLAFARCFRLLDCPKEAEIANIFGLGELTPAYLQHVETLVTCPGEKVIEDSPYFAQRIIFMVG